VRSIRLRSSCALFVIVMGTLMTSSTGRANSLTSYEWDEPVTLKLASGRRVEGRYRGTLGAASSTSYAERYAAWLDEVGSTSAPALGETLVVRPGSGEPLRGAFGGFFGGELLLATEDSDSYLIVPISGNDVRRTDEPAMDSDWIAARELWRSAPTPYSYVIQTEQGTVAVPATAIGSSAAKKTSVGSEGHGGISGGASSGGGSGGGGGGAVVAGVLVGALVAGLVAYVVAGAVVASVFSHLLI